MGDFLEIIFRDAYVIRRIFSDHEDRMAASRFFSER